MFSKINVCFISQWVTLEGVKSGMVHLRMTWLTLSSSLADLKAVSMTLNIVFQMYIVCFIKDSVLKLIDLTGDCRDAAPTTHIHEHGTVDGVCGFR